MKLRLILNSISAGPSRPPLDPAETALPPGKAPPGSSRRIWDIEPDAVALVTGLLFSRAEVEAFFAAGGSPGPEGLREDALRARLILACTRECALARAVEAVLDRRTSWAAPTASWPMIRIAEWWARECDRLAPEELAALLWRLSADPGPFLEPLARRVGGHLFARTTRAAREATPHLGWPSEAAARREADGVRA